MNRQRLFSLLYYVFIMFVFVVNGCFNPVLPIAENESLPPIVKTFKTTAITGGFSGMRNTGVYINKGDTYTVYATGSIDYCPSGSCGYNNVKPKDGWPIIAKIGENGFPFRLLMEGKNSRTVSSLVYSGNLFLGYVQGKMDISGNPKNPEYYVDDSGSFTIDIIVWEKEDYVRIAAFQNEMKERDPGNKAIHDALEFANRMKKIQIAEAETSKAVDQTKKQIDELKIELKKKEQVVKTETLKQPRIQPKQSTDDIADEEKIKALETKLSELMTTLTQLDEMKKQLEEERKKTAQLTQKLEEKDEMERKLLSKIEESSRNPPVLVIASPLNGKKTVSKVIQISGVAEDDKGLERLEIFINGELLSPASNKGLIIAARENSPKRINFNEQILLKKGANQIMIRVLDTEGLFSRKELTVYNIKRRRNIWAVVIGINDYTNIRKLKYAVNDARAFHDLLISNNKIPEENVSLLINQKASLTNLRSTLGTKLKNYAGKEDMVIIYFAGHGATEQDAMSPDGDGLEKYLLPYDADLTDLYSSALPMREISHIFHRIKSERIIFIADACYSGASGGRTVSFSGIRANISNAFLDRIISGKGTIIITASAANEVSIENAEFKHGVFTYYLLEALRGKADIDNDGIITVDEAYRYVSDRVPKATGQEQHPVKKGSVEGSLIFGIVP